MIFVPIDSSLYQGSLDEWVYDKYDFRRLLWSIVH